MLAYHFALLKLSNVKGYNYPGFALIDFPPTLADRTKVADKENYLIEPFVELFTRTQSFQVIVGGRAFKNLKGANRIPLTTVWKQPDADESEAPDDTPSLFPEVE
jgi:hypothetical protein